MIKHGERKLSVKTGIEVKNRRNAQSANECVCICIIQREKRAAAASFCVCTCVHLPVEFADLILVEAQREIEEAEENHEALEQVCIREEPAEITAEVRGRKERRSHGDARGTRRKGGKATAMTRRTDSMYT